MNAEQMRPPAPDALRGRRDADLRGWKVIPGAATRGEAWTDLHQRMMRVPFLSGDHGRLIRAHEMMHARVSPVSDWPTMVEALEKECVVIPRERAVECLEETRVNLLLARQGFDVDQLIDGSEAVTGARMGKDGGVAAWDETICYAVALFGTAAFGKFHNGVYRSNKEWYKTLTELKRDLKKAISPMSTRSVASTKPLESLNMGFVYFQLTLLPIVERYLADGPEAKRTPRRKGRRPEATGEFAPLIWDTSVMLDVTTGHGAYGHRRRPAMTGTRVRYPSRMITDPKQRIFASTAKSRGGTCVVDQSGSMSVTEGDLERLLAERPGLTVIGYSHSPGSTGIPNAWILAKDGRRASTIRPGNVGNGVDGPVLRAAVQMHRKGQPFVWVCDGQTTDSGDHAFGGGICAQIARSNQITMAGTINEALAIFANVSRGGLAGRTLIGRVGAAA